MYARPVEERTADRRTVGDEDPAVVRALRVEIEGLRETIRRLETLAKNSRVSGAENERERIAARFDAAALSYRRDAEAGDPYGDTLGHACEQFAKGIRDGSL